MTIKLPTEKVKASRVNAKRLVLYSKPKTGKTTALSMLENNLIIDLEDGTDFLDSLSVKATSVQDIQQIGEAIKQAGNPYKYVTIDTVTILEDMVKPLALANYKRTPIGTNYKEDDILKLPQGAGYYWLREAFFKVLNYVDTLADSIILSGHIKDKRIGDTGELVDAANIDLTGKIKSLICANADAVGYLYRSDNKTMLSFKSNDEITCGARPEHLKNQEIVLLESDKEGKLVSHWDKIYI